MGNESLFSLLEQADALKPLPGAVVPQMIRCSKPGCRCTQGKLHGPYFYRIWREAGRVQKVYVRKEDVPTVQEQTRLYVEQETELRRLTKLRREATQNISQEHKRLQRLLVTGLLVTGLLVRTSTEVDAEPG